MAAGRQRRRGAGEGQRERAGHGAARAAHRQRPPRDDRVVAADVDRAVVHEEHVGDPAEPLDRLVVVDARSARRSGCRSSSRAAPPTSRSSRWWSGVEGSITPSAGCRARPRRRRARRGRCAARTIGRARRRERVARPAVSSTSGRAATSAPSARTACRRGACARAARARPSSSASQARWKPPRPFSATIAPSHAAAPRPRSLERRRQQRAARTPGRRSARRGSGGRPGPRTRAGSRRTSRSRPSSCAPVVGDAADDREARPAIRAVDERVAVAAVGRVEQLARGSRAGGGVRRHERGAAEALARRDREAVRAARRHGSRRIASTRASGGASRRARHERVERPGRPRPRSPRRRRVADVAGEPLPRASRGRAGGSRRPGRRRRRGTRGAPRQPRSWTLSSRLQPAGASRARRRTCGGSLRPRK